MRIGSVQFAVVVVAFVVVSSVLLGAILLSRHWARQIRAEADDDHASKEAEVYSKILGTALQFAAAVAVLAGLFLSILRFEATAAQAELVRQDDMKRFEQLRADELASGRRNELQDRLQVALGQLSDDSSAVRVGAILELQSLLSASNRSRSLTEDSLLAVLAAHVREHAPLVGAPAADSRDSVALGSSQPADVRTALDAISEILYRVTARDDPDNQRRTPPRVDLSYCDLRGLKLDHKCFENVTLRGSDLSGSLLSVSSFVGADLSNTRLFDARVTAANFNRADLSGSEMLVAPETLTIVQLASARGDGDTMLPETLSRPTTWND